MGTGRRHGRGLEEKEREGRMQLYCNFLIAKKKKKPFPPNKQTKESRILHQSSQHCNVDSIFTTLSREKLSHRDVNSPSSLHSCSQPESIWNLSLHVSDTSLYFLALISCFAKVTTLLNQLLRPVWCFHLKSDIFSVPGLPRVLGVNGVRITYSRIHIYKQL